MRAPALAALAASLAFAFGNLSGAPATPHDLARARLAEDRAALQHFRPAYPFWRHVFSIPDGAVVYGSRRDGRFLVSFPVQGDWKRGARWDDDSLIALLGTEPLDPVVSLRREQVARLLEPAVGPVMHNATRGSSVLPNASRYGGFLEEWAAIYERFGVPAELGLAQALVESGFSGTARSRANALGLCQFLRRNWNRLDRLTPHSIEVENQTTQAAYCAAYLTVLSVKYGSFIPALSEHHAGPGNVGRVLITGARLGAEDVRTRYFTGADFHRDLHARSAREFREVVGGYGVRSFLYTEMVFGNTALAEAFRGEATPERIYAMRAPRNLPLREIVRRTGLSEREVKRFNPALVRQVPRGATVYLPMLVPDFGPDVTFWHRPAPPAFTRVLTDFIAMEPPGAWWDEPAFESALRSYRQRFRDTRTEEGAVMDAIIGYVLQEFPAIRRVLDEYRSSPTVQQAFDRGVLLRQTQLLEAQAPR